MFSRPNYLKLRLVKIVLWNFAEGDPKNYVPYYRRATVYLAMGKSKSALPDLDKVIELKPDFTAVSSFHWLFQIEIIGGLTNSPLSVLTLS